MELAADADGDLCPMCAATGDMETVLSNEGNQASSGSRGPGLEDGQEFGPYRIIRLLGRGGMGEVYEAEHAENGRRVALKVLRSQLQSSGDRARFLHEGQLAASISHPHAVYIYGSEEITGRPVIAMELLPGGTLKDRVVAEGPLPPTDAVTAILDIAGGLDAASAAGILHRDIKPSNCFNDHDGTVKVGDFGLSISTLARDVRQRIGAGGFEGTPQFAAPEQLRGQPLDVRADIYAVGATLYYLLTGKPPFDSSDLNELVRAVTTETPVSPRQLQPAVPSGLATIVLRCLAKSPVDRPASYAELSEALRPFSAKQDVPASPGPRLMAGLVDLLIVGIPASFLDSSQQVGVSFSTEASSGSSFHVNPWAWVVGVVYFLLVEGRWGASVGKRLFGLRLTSSGAQPSWRQVGIRTLLYQFSGMILSAPYFVWGTSVVEPWMVARPVLAAMAAALPVLVTVGLFLPARHRNGWAALHDRASGTRVVWRAAVSSRSARYTDLVEVSPLGDSSTGVSRLGPFDITGDLGPTPDGKLLQGLDPVLRRRVWIHSVAVGTPPVSAARRDVRRAGRLHWLSGRRSVDENWDAFEAPDGVPAQVDGQVPWAAAKMTLLELANELEASAREDTLPELAPDRIWTRENGRAVLLDFPAPGVGTGQKGKNRTPVALLAEVAALQMGSRSDFVPTLPLSAANLLSEWAAGRMGTLTDARDRLVEAARVPEHVPRLRRALPVLLSGLPMLMLIVAAGLALRTVRTFATPDNIQIVGLLTTLPERSPETQEAIEVYLAGHYRSQLADDGFWSSLVMQGNLSALRTPARELLAAHPEVTAEDLERVAPTVAPEVARTTTLYDNTIAPRLAQSGSALLTGLGAILLAMAVVSALISAVAVRGGVVFRLVGLATIRRNGREAGRGWSIVRVLLAWSPVIIWLVSLGREPVQRVMEGHTSTVVGLGAAILCMALGAAWSIARPHQGPHDWICRTWVVPR